MPGPGESQSSPSLRPATRPATRPASWLGILCALTLLGTLLGTLIGCGKGAYIERMDKRVKTLHDEAEANKKKPGAARPNIPGADGEAAAEGDAPADGAGADGADGGAPADEAAAGGEPPAE
ncbi:MAG: hypothetical protein U0795_07885 [Pirellulales bacterium]